MPLGQLISPSRDTGWESSGVPGRGPAPSSLSSHPPSAVESIQSAIGSTPFSTVLYISVVPPILAVGWNHGESAGGWLPHPDVMT